MEKSLQQSSALLSQENHLFELARTGHVAMPKFLKPRTAGVLNQWIYPLAALFFAYFVPWLSALLGLPFLMAGSRITAGSQVDYTLFWQLFIGFMPVFLLVWVWLYVFEGRQLWTVGLERPLLGKYLRGLFVGFLMISVAVLLLLVTGDMTLENLLAPQLIPGALAGALLLFVGWMAQGAAEEVLARGFLFPIFGIRFGAVIGILVSSVVFSVLHAGNPNIGPISYLNLALFGIFTCLYALFEGGLWGVCAIHSVWNWAQGNLYGLEVSGVAIKTGVLFDMLEVGPDWFTGGNFGTEGGLAVSGVLIAASILVIFASWRQKTKELI